MSRDTRIYSKKKTPVSMSEVTEALAARGLAVTWNVLEPVRGAKPTKWVSGYLLAEGETDQSKRIEVNNFTLPGLIMKQIADGVADERHAAHLRATKLTYSLPVTSGLDAGGEKLLANLTDVIAELGDGLIHDIQTDRFYTHEELH